MLLSLVIATHNRAELLPRTLLALTAQRLSHDVRYEVVFVDDGSTDDTPALIARAAQECDVLRYLRIDHTGSPARPRNVGMRDARGDVIVFVDDDVEPEPDFVQRHADFHRRRCEEQDAALGELYLSDDVRRDPMSLFHSFPYHEATGQPALSYLYFWTCNVSVKTTFMRRFGGFDEDAALHPLEDMECGHRLAKAGLRLHFLPEARGCHLHKLDPEAVSRKGRRTGHAQAALIGKIPDLALKRRFGILTPDQPLHIKTERLARRLAFRLVDNPLTHLALRAMGATNGRRSRASDLHYYLIFRRAMVAGFREAQADRYHGRSPGSTVWSADQGRRS
jgi:glycosyltransferase involved in cell wall biosynthesis